jgi:catechol 2,3-dioxygenase-like lactoylglutathione lyase family enzyme
LGLTVRDVDASAAWYEEVLGFRRAGEFKAPDGTRRKVFLRHDGLQARLGLTQHRYGAGTRSTRRAPGWTIWHSLSRTAGNSTPGRRGWQMPVSSIPRSLRRTPYRAPPCSSSATQTTFSSSCSPSRHHRRWRPGEPSPDATEPWHACYSIRAEFLLAALFAAHSHAARCVFVGFTVIGTRRSVGA